MARINVYFACDAGMGSSALGASLLKRFINEDIMVSNCSIYAIPQNCNIVIVHSELINQIANKYRYLKVYSIDHFLDETKLKEKDEEIRKLKEEIEKLK